MIALGHIIQIGYTITLSAIGVGIAMSGRRDPAVRDCPFCKGRGCERCGWSGEVDDREANGQEAGR
ncbi:hypothetical protein ACWEKR_05910 [Nocardia sp. NPDC004573]